MKKWLYRILMIVCIVVFCFSSYKLFVIFDQNHKLEKETEELEQFVVKKDDTNQKKVLNVDWESLKKKNDEIVAWVYMPECNISFPIVQGSDNSYYLTHTSKKEYNPYGAIFLNADNSFDFSDPNSIIFGHSTDDGGMFTPLKKFNDSKFFSENPNYFILTPKQNYKCVNVSFAKTIEGSVYYNSVVDDAMLAEVYQQATQVSDTIVKNKKLVTLSTCDLDYGFHSNHRLVLTSFLEEVDDKIYIEN